MRTSFGLIIHAMYGCLRERSVILAIGFSRAALRNGRSVKAAPQGRKGDVSVRLGPFVFLPHHGRRAVLRRGCALQFCSMKSGRSIAHRNLSSSGRRQMSLNYPHWSHKISQLQHWRSSRAQPLVDLRCKGRAWAVSVRCGPGHCNYSFDRASPDFVQKCWSIAVCKPADSAIGTKETCLTYLQICLCRSFSIEGQSPSSTELSECFGTHF